MGLVERIRDILPASSQSTRRMYEELSEKVDRLEEIALRVEQNQWRFAHESSNRDAKSHLYLDLLYSRDDETPAEARRRLFSAIPAAEGDLRMHQLASARLMHELDTICSYLGIEYWFAYGTLVAALSRHGFIPWDDDIDICIMRDDLEKLRGYLEGNDTFQVTCLYDRHALCRQMRFCLRDSRVPAFIDLSVWDYATDASAERDDVIRQLRLDLMDDLLSAEGLDYWIERPLLFAPGSGFCAQFEPIDIERQDKVRTAEAAQRIEEIFWRHQRKAEDAGVLCDKGSATAVAYALDNIYDAPWRQILWSADMIFPTRRCPFESYEFLVPRDAEEVMQRCYPGSPYIPDDIVGHDHVRRDAFSERETRAAIARFVTS